MTLPEPVPDRAAVPPDEGTRARIRTALDETLFVSAGAGSGKTSMLVDRVLALVLDEVAAVPMRHIAAITFTEKAATELRDRLRRALEKVVHTGWFHAVRLDADGKARAAAALAELDGAAISTLHSFAQRLLLEHPLDVDLPPALDVLDDIESEVEFEARWNRFLDELLDAAVADLVLRDAVLVSAAGEVTLAHLRELARECNRSWDLVADRMAAGLRTPPDGAVPHLGDLPRLAERLRAVTGRRVHGDDGDHLVARLVELEALADELASVDDPATAVAVLAPIEDLCRVVRCGNKTKWHPDGVLAEVREEVGAVGDALWALRAALLEDAVWVLVERIAEFTLAAVDERRAAGRLEFHDLLVMARRLVAAPGNTHVRRELHRRYQRLLLDEFQDTDPIQIELAVRIAAPPDAEGPAWESLQPDPGRLFFVGDPKQSIYRFRRADIGLYLRAQRHFGSGAVDLTANFRSHQGVVAWVNHTFGQLIQAAADSQPQFTPLTPVRVLPEDAGPAVTVIGAEPGDASRKADEQRRAEAGDVARVVRAAIDEGWRVEDVRTGRWRSARFDDIAILLPARTSLEQLEDALGAAGIPARAESSSLVYATREVRDLLMAARAVEDPTDELAVVSALRSSVLGCSDRELFDYRSAHRGGWNHQDPRLEPGWAPSDEDQRSPLPDDHPVVEGLRWLRSLHRRRTWLSPSEVLDHIVRDRRLMELAHLRRRPRDVWRRLRYVVDQARAWSDATAGDLRGYLAWVARQGAQDRVAEAVLPETDDEAVRILTVHAAKGLEFPIAVVSGLTTKATVHRPPVELAWTPRGLGLRIGRHVHTEVYTEQRPLDEQMSAQERLRLLYVACTRARDHLVVSVHRQRSTPEDDTRATNAELLARAGLDGPPVHRLPSGSAEGAAAAPVEVGVPGAGDGEGAADPAAVAAWASAYEAWHDDLREALTAGARPRTLSATAIAKGLDGGGLGDDGWPDGEDDGGDPSAAADVGPAGEVGAVVDAGLEKEPRDLELPPWNKGRYGTAVGRAVHAVLQTADLTAGLGHRGRHPVDVLEPSALASFDSAIAVQAAAEGVIGEEERLRALVWAALTSPRVAAASTSDRRWRETYVGVALESVPVEGYIDLLYRGTGPDGPSYVVVDYKTDTAADDADREALIERYAAQGATYALAVEAITEATVDEVVFLFLDLDGAHEVVLVGDRLDRTREEVRRRLRAHAAA